MIQVDSFESSSLDMIQETQAAIDAKFDYAQVAEAMKHDLVVAENVYARCAKRHFSEGLKYPSKFSDMSDHVAAPLYVAWVSVVVRRDNPYEDQLRDLTERVLRDVNHRECSMIQLVGPLSTRIAETSRTLLTFSLKQRWHYEG